MRAAMNSACRWRVLFEDVDRSRYACRRLCCLPAAWLGHCHRPAESCTAVRVGRRCGKTRRGENRSGALRGAHVGSTMTLMDAALSCGCSVFSGDSLAKNGAAQPVDEHRFDGGRVDDLRMHIGRRDQVLGRLFGCHRWLGTVRSQTNGSFWSKKSAGVSTGRRLARTDVSELPSNTITATIQGV